MAYSVENYQIIVEGVIGPSEVWSNTWTVYDVDAATDPQNAVDDFHAFYSSISSRLSDQWEAREATIVQLNTGLGIPATWSTLTGGQTEKMLPTQLAIRLSLNDNEGHHGGPFIAGFTEAELDTTGTLDSAVQTLLSASLDDLAEDLVTSGFQLRIDRPSVESTVPARRGRVGERFDVIRRRANDVGENYVSTNLLS